MRLTSFRQTALWVGALAIALAIPVFLSDGQQSIYVLLVLAAINTLGLSIVIGHAGQLSIGQAAFYAAGAYTTGIAAVNGVPTIIAFLLAPVVSMLLAWIVGTPLLRLSGPFLAFATLALHLVLLALISAGGSFTGGAVGLTGVPLLGIGDFELTSSLHYSWLAVLVAFLVFLIARNVINSRVGRALRGLGSSEATAAAAGVNVGRVKLSAFVLSAGFGGAAGGVYAFYFGFLSPTSFPVLLAFQFIIMATVGGMGTILGPILGATIVTFMVQGLNAISTLPGMPATAPSIFTYAVYAVLLILTVLFLPRGLAPALRDLWDRMFWKRKDEEKLKAAGGLGSADQAVVATVEGIVDEAPLKDAEADAHR